MAKYLFHGAYTLDGIRGVMKEGGTSRRDAVSRLIGGLGGTLESFYFAFGSDDFYITVDLPDNVSAAAIAMTVGAAGGASSDTIVLLTPEEVDRATKVSVPYRAPGQPK